MNFDEKAEVSLKQDENKIESSEPEFSPNEIKITFVLTDDDPAGYFDLVVENQDGQKGVLKDTFEIKNA